MAIVIAGGTGFLGQALVEAWRRDGRDVVVLTRKPTQPGEAAWSTDGRQDDWMRLVDGADAVVNLAGAGIADRRWTEARKATIRGSRLQATGALVEAIRRAAAPPSVFLSASAVGYYGPHGDETVTEETPPGSDFLAGVGRDWEAAAREAAARSRIVLLRTGIVLAASGGALPRIALPFRFYAGGRLGSGRQYMPWIHLDDWTGLTRWALAEPRVQGPLNLTAPEPVTNAAFTRALADALGRPVTFPVPAPALKLVMGEMADALLLTGQRAIPAKAQALGYRFTYPTVDAALRAIYA